MEKPEGQEVVADAVEEHQTTDAIPAEEVLPSLRETDPPAADPAKPAEAAAEQSGEQKPEGEGLSAEAEKAPEGEVDPTALTAPDAATDEPAQAEQPPKLDDYDEYSFTADGQSRNVPGTAVGEHGVFFSTESLTWLNQQLAIAAAHNGSWQRELTEARSVGQDALERTEGREAEANKIVEEMQALAEGDADAAYDWFQDYQQRLPILLAQAENARLTVERDQLQGQTERTTQAADNQDLQQRMVQGVETLITHYQVEYPDADVARVRTRLEMMTGSLFSQAQQDLPDGTKQGSWIIHPQVVEQEFQLHTELAGSTVSKGKAITEAGEANVAATTEGDAPPVASSKGSTPAATGNKLPKFRSQKEMDEYYESSQADRWAEAQLQS